MEGWKDGVKAWKMTVCSVDFLLELSFGRHGHIIWHMEVLGLLLDLDHGLDPNLLPWPSFGEHLVIPTEEVASIDEDVHLNR